MLIALCGRFRGRCGRRRLNSRSTKGPINDNPNLLGGQSAIDTLTVNEERGRSFDPQRFCFLC